MFIYLCLVAGHGQAGAAARRPPEGDLAVRGGSII